MPEITPEKIALAAYKAADGRKAADITVLCVNKLTTLTDYYLICSGQSSTQLRAIADAVDEALFGLGLKPRHVEGYPSATWILQDYGSVVVHLMKKDAREFYGLERLWADAPAIPGEELEAKGKDGA